jgi:hypothetical protein
MKVPGRETAPGPGRPAEASTSPLPVGAMQNTEASVALAGTPVMTVPAATPLSLIVRQAGLPKQPTCCGPLAGAECSGVVVDLLRERQAFRFADVGHPPS